MISEAYISGQIHQAIFKEDGDGYFLYAPVDQTHYQASPIRPMDFNSFLLSQPEIEFYKEINWTEEDLQTILNKHIAKHDALDLFLNGMDISYNNEIRQEAMQILVEDYFNDADVKLFVKNRILGTSVPKQFDPLSAAQIAEELNDKELVNLYKDLSYAREIITTVRHAWKKAIVENIIREDSIPILDKVCTDEGILAGFVAAILKHDGNAFDKVIITHSDKLKQCSISQPPLFLISIKKLVLRQYTLTDKSEASEVIANEDDDIDENIQSDFILEFNELINQFTGKKRKRHDIKKGEKAKLPNAANFFQNNIPEQINWIKKQISIGKMHDAEKGILALIQFQDISSNPEHLCKSLCDIAQYFHENGIMEMADLLAKRAIDLNTKDVVPHNILAENLRATGQLQAALVLYDTAITTYGNNRISRNGKAETLRELGQSKSALKIYNETITSFGDNIDSDNTDTYCGKAETLREMGDLTAALKLYNFIIDKFENNTFARNGKAETLREMGDLPAALELYNKTIEEFKDNIVARNGKAEVLRDMGQVEDALNLFNEIIRLFPNDQFAKTARLALFVQIGKDLVEESKEIRFKRPITKSDWVLYHIQCMLLIKQGKIDTAINKLKNGVKNNKFYNDNLYFKNALSYAFIKKRKYKEAIKELKQVNIFKPLREILMTHAYAADNNKPESIKHLNKIIKSSSPQIKDVSQFLSDRYDLSTDVYHQNKNVYELDTVIDSMEFALFTRMSLN